MLQTSCFTSFLWQNSQKNDPCQKLTVYKKIIRMFVGENESIVALFVIANKNILYFHIQLHITMFPRMFHMSNHRRPTERESQYVKFLLYSWGSKRTTPLLQQC